MNFKRSITSIVTIIASILFIIIGNNVFNTFHTESSDDMEVHKARIVSIDHMEEIPEYEQDQNNKTIYFTAKMNGGKQDGTIISGVQNIDSTVAMQDLEVHEGDNILVTYTDFTESGEFEWLFIGYNRVDALMLLGGVFLLLIVLIGRRKGISTILSLILTALIIFLVYVPSILSGCNIYLSTTIVGTVIIFMSLILINGLNRKTLCAILGNLGGVVITAILALIMNSTLRLTGFIDEHYVYLAFVNPENPLDLVAIIWGGMVLGSLGAIMDVAMSIASSMHEVSQHMMEQSFSKLLRSGMNIGRDAIATMTNTLILAYMGGSLALVLLLIVNTKNTLYLFSMEMISVQIVQSIVGSMGILFAVPFTAFFSAYVFNTSRAEVAS